MAAKYAKGARSMNYQLLTLSLIILALSAALAAGGHITRLRAWFNAQPAQDRADIVLIVVCVSALGAWGLT